MYIKQGLSKPKVYGVGLDSPFEFNVAIEKNLIPDVLQEDYKVNMKRYEH